MTVTRAEVGRRLTVERAKQTQMRPRRSVCFLYLRQEKDEKAHRLF